MDNEEKPIDNIEEKSVFKIQEVKYYRGKKQYLVRWVNAGPELDTWEFIDPKIKNFEEKVLEFENVMKKQKMEAKGARGGTKTGKWYYVSSSEEEEEIKDKFWLNLDKGKVDLFQNSDMYSGIKDGKRTPKSEAVLTTPTNKNRKSGADPLFDADIVISEDYLSETKRVTRSRINPLAKQKNIGLSRSASKDDRTPFTLKKSNRMLNDADAEVMPNDEDDNGSDDSSQDASIINLPKSKELFDAEISQDDSEAEQLPVKPKSTKVVGSTAETKTSKVAAAKAAVKDKPSKSKPIDVNSEEYAEKLRNVDKVIEDVIAESRLWYETNGEAKEKNAKTSKVRKNAKISDAEAKNMEEDLQSDVLVGESLGDDVSQANEADKSIIGSSNKSDLDEADNLDGLYSLPLKKRKSKPDKLNRKSRQSISPETAENSDVIEEPEEEVGRVKSSEEKKELARLISQSIGKKDAGGSKEGSNKKSALVKMDTSDKMELVDDTHSNDKKDASCKKDTSDKKETIEKKDSFDKKDGIDRVSKPEKDWEIKKTVDSKIETAEQMDSSWMRSKFESGRFDESLERTDIGIDISNSPKWEDQAEPSRLDVSTLKKDDLLLAVKNNDYLMVKFMTSHKDMFDLELLDDKSGISLVMIAARYGYNSILILLALNGANIERKAKDGSTALTIACERGLHITVAILCHLQVCLNAYPLGQETPLYKAVKNGHADVVRVLLKYGANCGALLSGDRSIFHFSKMHATPLITEILHTHKSKLINELYKEASRHFEASTKLDQVVFQPNILRMSEGNVFNIHFRYELQSMKSNRGMLLFAGHYRDGLQNSMCSLHGNCLINKIMLNDVPLQSLSEDSFFISTLAPLHDGPNNLVINTVNTSQANYMADLVVFASLVSITT